MTSYEAVSPLLRRRAAPFLAFRGFSHLPHVRAHRNINTPRNSETQGTVRVSGATEEETGETDEGAAGPTSGGSLRMPKEPEFQLFRIPHKGVTLP